MGYLFVLIFLAIRFKIPKRYLLFPALVILLLSFFWGSPHQIQLKWRYVRDTILNIHKLTLDEKRTEFLNLLTGGRYSLFKKGIELLETEWKEGDYLSLLVGHGLWVRKYFYDAVQPYYFESLFILSEYIARGVLGIAGILALFFVVFCWLKRWVGMELEEPDYLAAYFLPILFHFGYVIFNVFWHVDVPLFLLFFGLAECHLKKKSTLRRYTESVPNAVDKKG